MFTQFGPLLFRFGANPKVEQERDAAQLQAEEAMESLAKSREQLAKFCALASALDAELVAVRSDQQDGTPIEFRYVCPYANFLCCNR